MNCFYHPTVVAVGICKSCGKGLCLESAVDLGHGLACKGSCEEKVKALTDFIDSNIKRAALSRQIVDAAKGYRYFGAAFYLLFGLFLLGFSIYLYAADEWNPGAYLFIGMGLLFVGFGLVALRKAIQLSNITR